MFKRKTKYDKIEYLFDCDEENRKDKHENNKKHKLFIIDALLFILYIINNFLEFFIILFWDIVYKLVIFIPYVFGYKKIDKLDRIRHKVMSKTEYSLIVITFIAIIVTILNFILPNTPFKVTKTPDVTTVKEDNLTTNKDDNKSEDKKDETVSINKAKIKYSYDDLKKINPDYIGWLTVDNTNINYSTVQTTNNEYYMNHNFYKNYNKNGWVFGDYRNNWDNLTKNNIFYAHHLLNNAMFGSISKLFKDDWFKNSNHMINFKTKNKKYNYKIFSVYEIPTEVYYLQNEFENDDLYKNFLTELKNRSIYNFEVDLSDTINIITLSTCNDANNGRLVVHAKLISIEDI